MKSKFLTLVISLFLMLVNTYGQTQWTTDVDGGQNNLLNLKKLSVFKAATTSSSAQNLLSWSGVLADGQGWTVQNLISDHNKMPDGAGDSTLEKITNNYVASNVIYQQVDVDSAAGTYTFSWDVKKGSATNFLYAVYNLTNWNYIVAPTSYAADANTSTVTRMSIDFVKPAGCKKIQISPYTMSDNLPTKPDPSTGVLYLGRMQVRKTSFPATYVQTFTNPEPGSSTAATPAKYALFTDDSLNVGINTTDTKGYKLAVAGNIIAEKVRIKLQSAGWPDYVFESGYELPTLKYLADFIKTNKHLPGVSSAAEVGKEGIDLGDNQAVLLKKIEELTLYIIEQNKEIIELKKSINEVNIIKQKLEDLLKKISDK